MIGIIEKKISLAKYPGKLRVDPELYLQGEIEFRSLLFIPGMAPFNTDEMLGAKTKNIRLYVKRVFISDEFDGELVSLQSPVSLDYFACAIHMRYFF